MVFGRFELGRLKAHSYGESGKNLDLDQLRRDVDAKYGWAGGDEHEVDASICIL